MHPTDQLTQILPTLVDIVDGLDARQLGGSTPCDEFTVHDVLDHMIVLGSTFAGGFRGGQPAAAGAPAAYGRVPADEFRAVMADLLDAVRSEGAMERTIATPLGDLDGETFARVVAIDGLLHGWDLAVASGQHYPVDTAVIEAVSGFARAALTDDLRAAGMFDQATVAPDDASALEQLAAFSGRTVEPRWRTAAPQVIDKHGLPVKISAPGATARQVVGFGDASGYGMIAGEYFSLASGTDIAPLLDGLERGLCDAPHWGYMIEGHLAVTFAGGVESNCSTGQLFYWPPGHSVRAVDDSEVILFSPQDEHVAVLDHMLAKMSPG